MEETLTAVNCVLSTTLMIFMSLRAAFNSGREMMGKKKVPQSTFPVRMQSRNCACDFQESWASPDRQEERKRGMVVAGVFLMQRRVSSGTAILSEHRKEGKNEDSSHCSGPE